MKKTFVIKGREFTVRESMLDRVVNYFSPVKGAERLHARARRTAFEALSGGGYYGASKSRRAMSEFNPLGYDADSDILPDLPTLRNRCRDLVRNTPIATGAINTTCTNVVGTGLKLQSRIDREVLNITEDEADAWEANTEREFRLWADSQECDISRTQNFASIQDLAFRSCLENGDTFVLFPYLRRAGSPYGLKLQLIEADRVVNSNNARDTETLSGGIEKDSNGAPVFYHIYSQHPGNALYTKVRAWQRIPVFTGTGRRNIIHLFRMLRIGQTRGVPFLAPVIESLKQLGRYTEAELTAAVVSACFTTFIKTEDGDTGLSPMQPTTETGGKTTDADYKLAPGAIVTLAKNEDITSADPGRPNALFDPFVTSILRQVGVALEIPYEILIKNFLSSYSAARASLLEAWKFFTGRRQWLADNLCQLVYEAWMEEAVALDRVQAPGFFDDPIIRKAYLGSIWVGPARGMIDETKEVQAAKERIGMLMSTLEEETPALTGTDWESKKAQIRKEREFFKEMGIVKTENTSQKIGNQTNENMDENQKMMEDEAM